MDSDRSSRRRRLLAAWTVALVATGACALPVAAREPVARLKKPSARVDASSQTVALLKASHAVIGIEVAAVEGARSIDTLGQQRSGSGVVIGDDGLVLTIGYLLLEADEVSLRLDNGRLVPARVVGLDLASGLGLLQALLPLAVKPVPLAPSTEVGRDEQLLLVSGGNEGAVSVARLSARQAYSGYWEYHLDSALFTRPPRTDHSGAGVFNARGELLGIGSLLVMDTPGEHESGPGNMFVPVDLLPPVLAELRERGVSRAGMRAWLGINCLEHSDGVRVVRVNRDSPAEAAGLEAGDVITAIDGQPVAGLAAFYKLLWNGGQPERDITLQVLREGSPQDVLVHTLDRMQTLLRARSI